MMNREYMGMEERIHEMINGAIIGFSQVLVGHPFDTIKTRQQNNQIQNTIYGYNKIIVDKIGRPLSALSSPPQSINMMMKGFRFGELYKGFRYPMYMSCVYNAGCFSIYTWGIDVRKWSPFVSGLLAGGIVGSLSTPFEYYKIQKQTNVCCRKNINYISLIEIRRWMPSIGITTGREGIASGCYFGTYEWLHKNQLLYEMTGGSDFVNGGIAGCGSWLLTYPIDTVKTRRQSLTPVECMRTSWTKLVNMNGGLYGGIWICLIRAFIVNGLTFQIYELVHDR